MPSPSFAINGAAVNTKVSIAVGGTLQAILDSIDGVRSVVWTVTRTDDLSVAATITAAITQSGSVGQQADIAAVDLPDVGTCGILSCTINAGVDDTTGNVSTTLTQTVKWFVPTAGGFEVVAVGEFDDGNRESDATFGVAVAINAVIREEGGGLIDFKGSVVAATNAALPAYTRVANVITADANGALAAVDGVTLTVLERMLLKDGAAGADNGIYELTQVGTGALPFILTRTTDADISADVTPAMLVPVEEGTVNADQLFMLVTDSVVTLNTTALTFSNFGVLTPLVTAALRGVVSDLGAASTVLTTDGATAGGAWALLVDANVDAAAAVAGTKIAPNFGAQTVQTTGPILAGDGTAGAPSLGWVSDADATGTGFFRDVADSIAMTTGGTQQFRFFGTALQATNADGPSVLNVLPSNTVPSLVPRRSSTTTGVGSSVAGGLSLIAASREGVRVLVDQVIVQEPLMIAANGAHNVEILAVGDKSLGLADPHYHNLDPRIADRNVDLPAEAASDGLWYKIRNAGSTQSLVIRNDAAGVIVTLTPGQSVTVICDGTTWVHTGVAQVPVGYLRWGGDWDTLGNHLRVNGTIISVDDAAISHNVEDVVMFAGTIDILVWHFAAADATSVIKIFVNTVLQGTITLSGATGVDATLSITVAAGDRVAVEADAGTLPENGTLKLRYVGT